MALWVGKQVIKKAGGHMGRHVEAQVVGWVGRFYDVRGVGG